MISRAIGQRHQIKVLLIIAIVAGGCASRSRVQAIKATEDRQDVYLLAILVQDYFRNTDERNFNLDELNRVDSSNRISKNFERIEQVNCGGHISVQYSFSGKRNPKIDLTDKERQRIDRLRVTEKKYSGNYDGEIQYEYGERFYHLRKIVVKENRMP